MNKQYRMYHWARFKRQAREMKIVEMLWVMVSVLLLIYLSFSFWNAALSN